MNLIVNGDSHNHEGQGAIEELLREYQAQPLRTAVMVNGEVVPRKAWDAIRLREGDQVELLTIAAGG